MYYFLRLKIMFYDANDIIPDAVLQLLIIWLNLIDLFFLK